MRQSAIHRMRADAIAFMAELAGASSQLSHTTDCRIHKRMTKKSAVGYAYPAPFRTRHFVHALLNTTDGYRDGRSPFAVLELSETG